MWAPSEPQTPTPKTQVLVQLSQRVQSRCFLSGVQTLCVHCGPCGFEFGVSLKGEMFEKDPEFACIDIRCQVNFPPAQREVT